MKRVLYTCLAGLLLFSETKLSCQDTVSLKEVNVIAKKNAFSSIGKKVQSFDSIQKQQFVFNSVGELLSLNSPVFIKNYGPGSLSTSAFRGGSASHTGLLWNGFNIQSAMLGQTDLSLLPSVLFDDISLEYGGSSALWGSGAVAGSIHLSNKLRFNKGLSTLANIGGGSFGLFNASAGIEQSGERFISSTKLYAQNSTNTFLFKDTLDKENPLKEQRHAAYAFRGLMQEIKFLKGKNHMFCVSAWFNEGQREIPVFSKFSLSKPLQKDVNFKSSAEWNYVSGRLKSVLRGAGFYDEIHYSDPAFEINSSSFLSTFILENENLFSRTENNTMHFGINHTFNNGVTKNYSGSKTLNKTALSAGSKWELFQNKLVVLTSLRAEHFSAGNIPLTGNAAIEYKMIRNITAKLNGAKVYRQPTLNELYWRPGGNENLLPEQGYSFDGDLSWSTIKNHFSFRINGSAFYRIIDNWILWLPANNMSTPVNVQKVLSRGTETHSRFAYQKNKIYCALNVVTSYVLSTVAENRQENGNTLDRQLIYTPRYTLNSNITFAYSDLSFTIYHQYTGYRFSSSDNSQWLLPYHLFNARLSYKTKINTTSFIFFFACNNISDRNYSVVAGRPMPLRNFELGISLKHNKQKQQTIKTTE